jgi:hypothetical protein
MFGIKNAKTPVRNTLLQKSRLIAESGFLIIFQTGGGFPFFAVRKRSQRPVLAISDVVCNT